VESFAFQFGFNCQTIWTAQESRGDSLVSEKGQRARDIDPLPAREQGTCGRAVDFIEEKAVEDEDLLKGGIQAYGQGVAHLYCMTINVKKCFKELVKNRERNL
jgi:hypothetical protein